MSRRDHVVHSMTSGLASVTAGMMMIVRQLVAGQCMAGTSFDYTCMQAGTESEAGGLEHAKSANMDPLQRPGSQNLDR